LEGPEAGVYYRGTASVQGKSVTIELPEYVTALAKDFTVHLTCKGSFSQVYASDVTKGAFVVYADKPCEFYWVVYGRRGEINTEPLRMETQVHGEGPYKWVC
jgi:hypothetical protein